MVHFCFIEKLLVYISTLVAGIRKDRTACSKPYARQGAFLFGGNYGKEES